MSPTDARRAAQGVHEPGASHMADGYARVSGRHGVLIGQNGPGISNCVTAIAAAYGAHSPVIIVTPETGTMGMGLGGFQEAHQLPMIQEFTKYQGQVVNPKRTAEFTARCFDRAISEMGPTQLNIPRDYFYGEVSCEIPRPMRVERGSGPQDVKIIQVEADHTNLGLVKKISLGIRGDAKAVAKALLARIGGQVLACDASKAQRAATIAAEKSAWEQALDAWTHETDAFSLDMIEENGQETPFSGGRYLHLHPRQVLCELEKAMPPRVMVSTDIGNINAVSNSYLRFDEPRSFFAPMSFGNCGDSLPTMIGAKVAAPDRPAVAYTGDGAWGMSMSEIMTCLRHDIPVTAAVFHSRHCGAEKKNQVDFYNRRFVAGELDNQSFSGSAKAMGAEAIIVDQLEDLGPALKRAIDLQMNQKKTCVIEILCTREPGDPFRRDALSRPVRFLDKYKD